MKVIALYDDGSYEVESDVQVIVRVDGTIVLDPDGDTGRVVCDDCGEREPVERVWQHVELCEACRTDLDGFIASRDVHCQSGRPMTDMFGVWRIIGPEDHLILQLPAWMGRADIEQMRQQIPPALRDRTMIMVDFRESTDD